MLKVNVKHEILPLLVLKVDVELGEGGQLALVALASFDRACGQCATNNRWAIWSKELHFKFKLIAKTKQRWETLPWLSIQDIL